MSTLELPNRLAYDIINALSANIAVLDSNGVVIAVNEAWIRFARQNGATDERFYVGSNYLAVCRNALASGAEGILPETVEKLRAIIAGEAPEVSAEYPCDSPTERRWFSMRATRLHGPSNGEVVLLHEDITDRKRKEQTLRETERLLRSVLEALPVGVWLVDRNGTIVDGNPAARQIWAGARLVGPEQFGEYKGWWVSTGKPIEPEEWAAARAIRKGETSLAEEIEIECFDGTRKIILNSAIPLRDEGERIEGAIIVNQDITARKRDETELRRAKEDIEAASLQLSEALDRERVLARIDALTGITNRRHFFALAEHELSVAERYKHSASLVIIDVDHLKQVNDTLGHQAGDELLRSVARIGQGHLREADLYARYGGDEFVLFLPQTEAADAVTVVERLRHDLAGQSIVVAQRTVRASISSGIAGFRPGDTLDTLIRRADIALYRAKKAGRDRTVIFRTARAGAR